MAGFVPVKASIRLVIMSVTGFNGLNGVVGLLPEAPVFPVADGHTRGAPLTPGIATSCFLSSIRAVWICGASSPRSSSAGSLTAAVWTATGAGAAMAAGSGSPPMGWTTPGGGGPNGPNGVLAAVNSGAIEKEIAGGRKTLLREGRNLKSKVIEPT